MDAKNISVRFRPRRWCEILEMEPRARLRARLVQTMGIHINPLV